MSVGRLEVSLYNETNPPFVLIYSCLKIAEVAFDTGF